jgi:hypothetical protein
LLFDKLLNGFNKRPLGLFCILFGYNLPMHHLHLIIQVKKALGKVVVLLVLKSLVASWLMLMFESSKRNPKKSFENLFTLTPYVYKAFTFSLYSNLLVKLLFTYTIIINSVIGKQFWEIATSSSKLELITVHNLIVINFDFEIGLLCNIELF